MFTAKGKNILIIDDDQDITNLFQIFLEYDGYRVNALPILYMPCILLEEMS